MKLNSPFFIPFLLIFCLLGCHDAEVGKSDAQINHYLDLASNDSVMADKRKHLEKAIFLAKEANDTSLYYYSVLTKLDCCIVSGYPDSTSFYLDHLLEIAPKTRNKETSIAYILTKKGDYAHFLGDYRKAYGFYDQSKKIYEEQKDSLMMGYNLVKLATILQVYTDYSGSEETLTEAIAALENHDSSKAYLREAYNMLGIAYTATKNYGEAIRNYRMAKGITNDELSKKIIDSNIALCYLEDSKPDLAIKMFTALYESETVKADTVTLVRVMDNLGYSKFKKDGNSGRELMEEALALRIKRMDNKGMVYGFLNLSEYHGSKNPALALSYAQKAYGMATQVGAIDHRVKALKLLATYGGQNYNLEYFRLNDSITDVRKTAKNEFAKLRYDATKARNNYLAIKIDQAEAEVRNLILTIAAAGIILALVVLYVFSRIRRNKEKRMENYKAEIRIAKKLHDELANDVFNTMTFAEIRDLSDSQNKEVLLDNLDRIYTQTRNISKENNTIDTGEDYLVHLKEMLSGYGSEQVNIIIKEIDSFDWYEIEATKKIVVYRILQELLVNMKKHSKATLVVISFKKVNKIIEISYSDNGVGMGHEEQKRKNGLQNVENRIQSINGTITFDPIPEKGFKVIFSFKA